MPRFLRLAVSDLVDDTDALRDEWVNPDHIERIRPFGAPDGAGEISIWLEVSLCGGLARYVPVGACTDPAELPDFAEAAIRDLFDLDHPNAVIALTDEH